MTHNWSNYFHHLMAAIFADALEEEHYAGLELRTVIDSHGHCSPTFVAGVAEMLLTAEGYQRLENKIQVSRPKFGTSCASMTCINALI